MDAKHVFVGSDDRFIYAFDRNTGDVKWKYLTEGRVHSAQTLVDDALYSGCHDGYVYCLKAATGKLNWKFKTGSLVNSTVAFRDGQVYFGSYDKHVYALKATDGTLLWKTETDPGVTSHIVASPAVTEDAVFIGTWPGMMYAFERNPARFAGAHRWAAVSRLRALSPTAWFSRWPTIAWSASMSTPEKSCGSKGSATPLRPPRRLWLSGRSTWAREKDSIASFPETREVES